MLEKPSASKFEFIADVSCIFGNAQFQNLSIGAMSKDAISMINM